MDMAVLCGDGNVSFTPIEPAAEGGEVGVAGGGGVGGRGEGGEQRGVGDT